MPFLESEEKVMFLYSKKKSEEQELIDMMNENNYRLKIVDLEAQVSMLELQLAVKDCLIKAYELREVTGSWRK